MSNFLGTLHRDPCLGVFIGYTRDIRGVFMGYTYVSGMYRVCIGKVSEHIGSKRGIYQPQMSTDRHGKQSRTSYACGEKESFERSEIRNINYLNQNGNLYYLKLTKKSKPSKPNKEIKTTLLTKIYTRIKNKQKNSVKEFTLFCL